MTLHHFSLFEICSKQSQQNIFEQSDYKYFMSLIPVIILYQSGFSIEAKNSKNLNSFQIGSESGFSVKIDISAGWSQVQCSNVQLYQINIPTRFITPSH